MLYTITEISELINLSKVSVYKRLKLKEMEPFITIKNKTTYVNDEGLTFIKTTLSNVNRKVNISTDEAISQDDYLSLKKEYINQLKQQITEKDIQISKLLELNKNNQILLKENPQQNILLLEEHFQDLDTKLEDVKNNMAERKEHHNKGFFSKIFKK